jgi:HEAT repeat protein
MNARRFSLSPALCVLAGALILLLAAPLGAGEAEAPAKDDLAELVNSLPDVDGSGKYTGPSPEEAQERIQNVLEGGKARLLALTAMLKEPEKGEDYKADYLLHAIATHAKRPGAEDERALVCDAITTALAQRKSDTIRWHLLEELKWIGGEESVDAVSKFLLHEKLSDYAVEVLVQAEAAEPMRDAVARAKGEPRQHVIQGLGALRAAKGIPSIVKDLEAKDPNLQRVAAYALANSGEPTAVEPMLEALKTDSAYIKAQIIDKLLLLARRLGQDGQKEPAARICRHLLKSEKDAVHVQCAALLALAEAVGSDAMDDVIAAMGSEDPNIRKVAIEAAIAMPGAAATEHWIERLKSAKPASKTGILDLLARRGDPAALPAVLEATKSPNAKVRLAAIQAAGKVGNTRAVKPLVGLLSAKDSAEKAAARTALIQLSGVEPNAAIADALRGAAPKVQADLLGILAARGAKDQFATITEYARKADDSVAAAAAQAMGRLADAEDISTLAKLVIATKSGKVRSAAEKALALASDRVPDKKQSVNTLADALKGAEGQARASLLRVLASIGGSRALGVVRDGLGDKDEAVQDAAIRALSEWPTDEPAETLLDVAKRTEKLAQNVLALRGYVRMIGLRKTAPASKRLQMCRDAMAACRRPDEKRLVLGALRDIASPEAIAFAEEYYDDKALQGEAAMAALQVAEGISALHRAAAKQAVKKAVAATDSKAVKGRAEKVLYEIERYEDFITAWLVAGPYPGGVGNKKHFPPEKPKAKVDWKLVTATGRQPGVLDLHKEVSRGGNICVYLKCQIRSPEKQKARLEVGTDDGVKVWLNGKLIHDNDVARSLEINQDKVPVTLNEGWNDLLVRVTEGGGDWAAAVRVRGPEGKRLEGIEFKAE